MNQSSFPCNTRARACCLPRFIGPLLLRRFSTDDERMLSMCVQHVGVALESTRTAGKTEGVQRRAVDTLRLANALTDPRCQHLRGLREHVASRCRVALSAAWRSRVVVHAHLKCFATVRQKDSLALL